MSDKQHIYDELQEQAYNLGFNNALIQLKIVVKLANKYHGLSDELKDMLLNEIEGRFHT